jgi:hypothetical protein
MTTPQDPGLGTPEPSEPPYEATVLDAPPEGSEPPTITSSEVDV